MKTPVPNLNTNDIPERSNVVVLQCLASFCISPGIKSHTKALFVSTIAHS